MENNEQKRQNETTAERKGIIASIELNASSYQSTASSPPGNVEASHGQNANTSTLTIVPSAANVSTSYSAQGSTNHKILRFCLRLCLFSPLKWKRRILWISVPHFLLGILHIIKIVYLSLLTLHIGRCRSRISTLEDNRFIALHHILLRNWDSSYETLPYPPSQGKFAVYNVEDFQNGINFAVEQIYNIEVEATGDFIRAESDSIAVYFSYYEILEPIYNGSGQEIVNKKFTFTPERGLSEYTNEEGQTLYRYNVTEDLIFNKLHGVLKRVFELNLIFSLHAVRIDEEARDAICHQLKGKVTFSDKDRDGQFVVTLNTKDYPKACSSLGFDLKKYQECDRREDWEEPVRYIAIITAVTDGICLLGGLICLVWTCCSLKGIHYKEIYKPIDDTETHLPFEEYFWNVPWWLMCSFAADVLTLKGVFRLPSKDKEYELYLEELDRCVTYIGSGYLLTMFSFLRFLRFSPKFTILFKTARRSAVDVLFFLVCVAILSFGFGLSTYIVLGPYHIKFQTPSSTAETLFSIINGDEIYETFAILQENYSGDSGNTRTYLKVIVYVYVSLFTVLVFNLLIALFNSAYETVKESSKSEEETLSVVIGLRNYINYKRNNDDNFSTSLRTIMESNGPLEGAETELRKILRNYVLPRHSNGGLAVIESRERSLFFFMCHDVLEELTEKESKCCLSACCLPICCCTVVLYLGCCFQFKRHKSTRLHLLSGYQRIPGSQ